MQKPLTPKRLENIALFYLERFDTSCGKLRQVLKRRVQRQKIQGIPVEKEIDQWIEQVIHKMQELGYVNDERYVQNTIRRLSESGKSTRFIQQKLSSEGIDSNLIESLLSPEEELDRATIFAHKKHLGSDPQKDLAKLARAGFNYDIAKHVLDNLSD